LIQINSIRADLVQKGRYWARMGTSVRQFIDFGGDEASDSSQVELLRLQPMLPKSLGVAESHSPAAIALAALPTNGLSLIP
jgi:hypothetical protein